MPNLFIEDGHTCDGFITESVELDIPAIQFKYRPAFGAEDTQFLQHRDVISGEERANRDAKFMAEHLVGWDVRRRDNSVVEITAENCKRIHHTRQSRMIDIISGYSVSDPLPNGVVPEHHDPQQSLGN